MPYALGLARRLRWRLAVVPIVVIALVGAVMLNGESSSAATYRTAEVTTGDVAQTLTATGSIESATREDLAFQVAGTVDSVSVAVGDSVAAGDVLATLDTSDFEDAVTTAEEALTAAEDALADDLEAQADETSTSSTSTVSYTSSGDAATSVATAASAVYTSASSTAAFTAATVSLVASVEATTSATPEATAEATAEVTADAVVTVDEARTALIAAQEALLAQYDEAQALLLVAQQASVDAQEVCDAFIGAVSGTGADADVVAAALTACQEATTTALTASQDSIDAQAQLMSLAASVDEAVAALQQAYTDAGTDASTDDGDGGPDAGAGGDAGSGASAPGDATDATGGGVAPSGSGTSAPDTGASGADASSQAGGATGDSGSESSSAVPSAADILADKADITAAEAALAVVQQQLEYTSLAAPVAGDVVAVDIVEGSTVSAADASAMITILADNTYLVELGVSLTEAQLLAVQQPAELTLTSTGEVVEGVVSSVSSVNSGNSFSQSYAVTIAIADPGFEIRIGAATRMQITVAGATGVLVVPTSAVSGATGDATVQRVGDDGEATTTSIVAGAIGSTYTEVVSGLEVGDTVVLADLSIGLSSEDTAPESSGGLLSGLSDEEQSTDTSGVPAGGPQQGGTGPGTRQG